MKLNFFKYIKIFLLLPIFLFALRNEPIIPIPQTIKYDREKALLGKELFFDSSISEDGTVSCASCHSPRFGGADPRPVSIGVYGKLGNIQSPTVYNSVYNFRQFWNGRARDLNEQIDGPTHNPVEMGLNEEKVEKILNNNKRYKKLFQKIYHKNKITYDMFKDAIVEFETALITPDCRFDKWLRGEIPLSKEEKEGYLLFKKFGCITCHNGINIGGNSFQKIGVIHSVKNRVGDWFEVTKNPIDKFVYKVPTLRNIALTAPYFHNAETDSLSEAVQNMAYYNLGLYLSEDDNKKIVSFLKSLTGKKPKILEDGE